MRADSSCRRAASWQTLSRSMGIAWCSATHTMKSAHRFFCSPHPTLNHPKARAMTHARQARREPRGAGVGRDECHKEVQVRRRDDKTHLTSDGRASHAAFGEIDDLVGLGVCDEVFQVEHLPVPHHLAPQLSTLHDERPEACLRKARCSSSSS